MATGGNALKIVLVGAGAKVGLAEGRDGLSLGYQCKACTGWSWGSNGPEWLRRRNWPQSKIALATK